MKIFSAAQIRAWDRYTIENEPISSVELMQRAAQAFADWWMQLYPDTSRPVVVLAGTGNNGGDGLAVARLLDQAQYNAKVIVCDFSGSASEDFRTQMDLFPDLPGMRPVIVSSFTAFISDENCRLQRGALLIDALFGSGLNRPLQGDWALLVEHLNALDLEIAAIDLPSGLLADGPTPGRAVLHAHRTFSFQTPKRSFFYPENAAYLGDWSFGSIGLHPEFERQTPCDQFFTCLNELSAKVPVRHRFAHKGNFGHALLIAGSKGKMGAAVLAARACLRAGVGLLSVHVPQEGLAVLQTAVPEAMAESDSWATHWTDPLDANPYSAIGIGPGIGKAPETAAALHWFLQQGAKPLVIDADALNLIAEHPDWLHLLPKDSILSPHPKEQERLFGKAADSFERLAITREKAVQFGVYIILKGAFTAIACPDGSCLFNSSGNPGMATGGSGDVLTGILTSLRAQGFSAQSACELGVFLHGLAGDLAAAAWSEPGMIAGDLPDEMGKAWKIILGGKGPSGQ